MEQKLIKGSTFEVKGPNHQYGRWITGKSMCRSKIYSNTLYISKICVCCLDMVNMMLQLKLGIC